MAHAVTESEPNVSGSTDERIINDVVVKIATANGSGSQSANLILMKSIFRMGIPVSSKNMFPSNISGLPTWYTIRVNENGWLAQKNATDVAVLMNSQTVADDLAELEPGAAVIINKSLESKINRDDLNIFVVPFDTLVKEASPDTRLRKKVVNVVYVGVLAWLLDMDIEILTESIKNQFAGKKKAADINIDAATVGYQWADQSLDSKLSHCLETRELTKDLMIIEGNEATAIGLMFGGVTVVAWYPITPSSSVCENLEKYLDKHRRDPDTGKATFAVVQAEDEIASIGMVLGAGWAGARACTATSGPGISLMAEMAGLSYFAEIPAVIIDVQRMGPSTGLPTRNSQGDIASAYQLSHGDTRHVLLIPGTMEECYSFATQALDLAEELQTLVFLMSDLDLGMNKWTTAPFAPPSEEAIPRGKVLSAEEVEKAGSFNRYEDVDGDGIPYRTIPGTDHPKAPYFTRGTGHNISAVYSEKSDDWQRNVDRLLLKYNTARTLVPQPIIESDPSINVAIIAYGSSDGAVREALHLLKEREDMDINYLRLRALPLTDSVVEFLKSNDTIYVVEQNRDAQVAAILKSEHPEHAAHIQPILHYNGMPLDAETIVTELLALKH
ncbi:2-oxoacid:acceptor oxidoreductase subunit alpha [bacterium AH-315-P07]|nr:2-oxoacid:acceptor oxidoreductase subunit alpha [bacterium AH-315-P07]